MHRGRHPWHLSLETGGPRYLTVFDRSTYLAKTSVRLAAFIFTFEANRNSPRSARCSMPRSAR